MPIKEQQIKHLLKHIAPESDSSIWTGPGVFLYTQLGYNSCEIEKQTEKYTRTVDKLNEEAINSLPELK